MKTKDATITIRCTKTQKLAIERNAEKKGLSTSNYMVDKCMRHNKNRHKTIGDREICKAAVKIQGALNDLELVAGYCGPYSENLKRIINTIRKEEKTIWDNSLR